MLRSAKDVSVKSTRKLFDQYKELGKEKILKISKQKAKDFKARVFAYERGKDLGAISLRQCSGIESQLSNFIREYITFYLPSDSYLHTKYQQGATLRTAKAKLNEYGDLLVIALERHQRPTRNFAALRADPVYS